MSVSGRYVVWSVRAPFPGQQTWSRVHSLNRVCECFHTNGMMHRSLMLIALPMLIACDSTGAAVVSELVHSAVILRVQGRRGQCGW